MPASRGEFTFDEVLPRLVGLYESGRLVPFIGAGMSMPNCRGWEPLVIGLEAAAGAPAGEPDRKRVGSTAKPKEKPRPEELIRRVIAATRRLKSGAGGEFEKAFESALFDPTHDGTLPKQTAALAAIWWPLVLTTNYDNFYVEAFSKAFDPGGLRVVGRGAEDCQRVLTSLSTAGRAVLWALQGHIGRPCPPRENHREDTRLTREIVLDHAEYRRVTHREPHFRRAFAEVFRQRSLFFLGAGIAEPYFQELFGEILEFYGPSARTHYALMPGGEVDPRFMYSRFQIAVIEYTSGDYEQVPQCLAKLATELDRRATVPNAWSWGATSIQRDDAARLVVNRPALEVRFGALPTKRDEGDCLAVSAGGRPKLRTFFLSRQIYEVIGQWGVPIDESKLNDPGEGGVATKPAACEESFVGEYLTHHVFAVRARNERDEKDLSRVAPASTALFNAAASRYSRIHMQLLASGGSGSDRATWSRRPFPARFTFIEIVRAWGEWKRRHPENRTCLTLHIVEPSICREIASGRIDVGELLLADDLRFWAEIVESDGTLERRLFHKAPDTTLSKVVDELGLSSTYWTIDVSPPASIDDPQSAPPIVSSRLGHTLRALRVVPGGTLHFHRV
jgi:hypothetical protein